jgi:hypothetical protein
MSPQYLAGIIDGEGHIRFAWSNYKYRYPRISVVNTHKPLLDAIAKHYGGSIKVHTKANNERGWSQSWTWNTAGANATKILALVMPYLIVKRERAAEVYMAAVTPLAKVVGA